MHELISDSPLQKSIIQRFIDAFVKDNFCVFDDETGSRNLLWCCFRDKGETIATTELSKIKLPANEPVFFTMKGQRNFITLSSLIFVNIFAI